MKTMSRIWLLVVLTGAFLMLPGGLLSAQKQAPAKTPNPADEVMEVKKEIYYYQAEMKALSDPFRPLTLKETPPVEDGKILPPLQKYDISQMKLFAVVLTQNQQYAMMLLPDGKYYTVLKGDKIGLHEGYVSGMELNKVRIIEKIITYKGETTEKEAILRLREEEGE